MDGVYTQYFQKSKVFLYPLVDLKKGIDYVPEQTYIAWDKLYSADDMKFLCLYNAKVDQNYISFENKHLKNHPNLEASFHLDDNKHIYVFDFSCYEHDYNCFLKGKYSNFSIKTKERILNFFGSVGNISQYVKAFIEPDKYHDIYADALNVEVSLIKQVNELCSIPNLKKETIFEKVPQEIKLFKNNNLPLDKY